MTSVEEVEPEDEIASRMYPEQNTTGPQGITSQNETSTTTQVNSNENSKAQNNNNETNKTKKPKHRRP